MGFTAAIALTACVASGRSTDLAHRPAVMPAPSGAVTDVWYDWHGLLIMPFGTLLKDSPVPLHEVLQFHDETLGPADAESKDCYAVDGAAPRFVRQKTDQFLMCFDHDRLNRIEAGVPLDAADATEIFVHACASWLKTPAVAPAGNVCEGRDGPVAFSARLVRIAGEVTARLSMTLTSAVPREIVPDVTHVK